LVEFSKQIVLYTHTLGLPIMTSHQGGMKPSTVNPDPEKRKHYQGDRTEEKE
jgi:hypothetical protein